MDFSTPGKVNEDAESMSKLSAETYHHLTAMSKGTISGRLEETWQVPAIVICDKGLTSDIRGQQKRCDTMVGGRLIRRTP
eukprot:6966883-Ditylum_brightwellii.AAC.1